MKYLPTLFDNNQEWASTMTGVDVDFFNRLVDQQSPDYLWIGCSDSRVPANEIVGLLPGELFVHRNLANQVLKTDLNCLSVIQFAVDILNVEHVIVCGHYGCGGVRAAMASDAPELVDAWLVQLRTLYRQHRESLSELSNEEDRMRSLCELNVMEQVRRVGQLDTIQQAWKRNQLLTIHGWIYDIADGLLHDLDISTSSM